jgi:hypothetical protein
LRKCHKKRRIEGSCSGPEETNAKILGQMFSQEEIIVELVKIAAN